MKPNATLKNAVFIVSGDPRSPNLRGSIYEDDRGRFPDGMVVNTSRVERELTIGNESFVVTKSGTIYRVEWA